MKTKVSIVIGVVIYCSIFPLEASNSSSGLILLQPGEARSTALGGAYTAASNDIGALFYNPASLTSLDGKQISLLYRKGFSDDAYGQFMYGAPLNKGSFGFSFGYYDGGDFQNDDGSTVSAEKDMSLGLAYALQLGQTSIGLNGKYLNSQLIGTYKATAYGLDIGISRILNSRLNAGASLQNLGTQLTYVDDGNPLPALMRGGVSYLLRPSRYPLSVFADGIYLLNDHVLTPAVGAEWRVGVMALRTGFKAGTDRQEFTVGTGFNFGRTSIDYSFGLMNSNESQNRVSVAMRFGGKTDAPVPFEKRTNKATQFIAPAAPVSSSSNHAEKNKAMYIVKPGDSFESIAKKHYGNAKLATMIKTANQHLVDKVLQPGQKIILP